LSPATTAPRLAVVGAGTRGQSYAALAAAAGAEIVAVAEPDEGRRRRLGDRFGVPAASRSPSWERLELSSGDVDGVVIATMDGLHVDPALRFAPLGVPLLLEKPIAATWEDCMRLDRGLGAAAPPVVVAHVLRYAPYTRLLRDLIEDGSLGDIMSVHHLEPVGFWHFAHSFVRGNWRSTADAAPFLVSKACHDVDWVMHLIGSECVAVASFGSLKHFRPEMRPIGAADRCVDCSVACDYDARRIYLDMADAGDFSFPVSTIVEEPTVAAVEHALAHGPHGRCVYGCDNDVVDTQVASLLFYGGETATITVSAFTEARGRHSVIAGTRAEATVTDEGVSVYSFRNRRRRFYPSGLSSPGGNGAGINTGHAGGDGALVDYFLSEITAPTESGRRAFGDALCSHRVAFAIERARRDHRVVDPREPLGETGSAADAGWSEEWPAASPAGSRQGRSLR
jgi:predicted dehydrogenase